MWHALINMITDSSMRKQTIGEVILEWVIKKNDKLQPKKINLLWDFGRVTSSMIIESFLVKYRFL